MENYPYPTTSFPTHTPSLVHTSHVPYRLHNPTDGIGVVPVFVQLCSSCIALFKVKSCHMILFNLKYCLPLISMGTSTILQLTPSDMLMTAIMVITLGNTRIHKWDGEISSWEQLGLAEAFMEKLQVTAWQDCKVDIRKNSSRGHYGKDSGSVRI